MNLFIIIVLLMRCVCLFGDKMGARFTKTSLRGMYKEELDRRIQESWVNTFDHIYDQIIQCAQMGKNEHHFTIMCQELTSGNCDIHNGHQEWIQNHPKNIITTSKSHITIEQYTTIIINWLKQVFLDSNFTTTDKNCCEYHIVKW